MERHDVFAALAKLGSIEEAESKLGPPAETGERYYPSGGGGRWAVWYLGSGVGVGVGVKVWDNGKKTSWHLRRGAWRSSWTASNLAQCRVGWDAFETQEEAEAHQKKCTHPDGVSYHCYDTPGESWSN